MTKIQSIRQRVAKLVKQAQEDRNPAMGENISLDGPTILNLLGTGALGYAAALGKGAPLRFWGEGGSEMGKKLWSGIPWVRNKSPELQDWHRYVQHAPERKRGIVRADLDRSTGVATYNGTTPDTDLTRLARMADEYSKRPSMGLYKNQHLTPVQKQDLISHRRNLADYMNGEIALQRLEAMQATGHLPPGVTAQDLSYLRNDVYGGRGISPTTASKAYSEFKNNAQRFPNLPVATLEDYALKINGGSGRAHDTVRRVVEAAKAKQRGGRPVPPALDANGIPMVSYNRASRSLNPASSINVQIPGVPTKLRPTPPTRTANVPLQTNRGQINPVVGKSHLKAAPLRSTIKTTLGGGATAGLMYLLAQAAKHNNEGSASKATPAE